MILDILKLALGAVVLWFAVVWLGRFLGWVERSEIARQKAEAEAQRAARISGSGAAAPASALVAHESEGVPAQHVAVIAAAVAAYGYRVVHIADAATGRAWTSEGRWQHQTSHRRN